MGDGGAEGRAGGVGAVRMDEAAGARPFATASKFPGGGVARDGGPASTGAPEGEPAAGARPRAGSGGAARRWGASDGGASSTSISSVSSGGIVVGAPTAGPRSCEGRRPSSVGAERRLGGMSGDAGVAVWLPESKAANGGSVLGRSEGAGGPELPRGGGGAVASEFVNRWSPLAVANSNRSRILQARSWAISETRGSAMTSRANTSARAGCPAASQASAASSVNSVPWPSAASAAFDARSAITLAGSRLPISAMRSRKYWPAGERPWAAS